jgi:hypothetical protein
VTHFGAWDGRENWEGALQGKGRTAQGQMPDESNSPYCLCACCVEEGEWPMAAFVDP